MRHGRTIVGAGVVVIALSGCVTILTLAEDTYRNKIYSGTLGHIEGRCAHGLCVDMPFSLVADTVLLPITIPWTVVNFTKPYQEKPDEFRGQKFETVTRAELLKRLDERISKKGSDRNFLTYMGTREQYHYLVHMYDVGGWRHYRISDAELSVPAPEIMPLTVLVGETKRIARIGNEWQASRKSGDAWVPDPRGLTLSK